MQSHRTPSVLVPLRSMRAVPPNSVHPLDRAARRAWLERHHGRAEGVWLVAYEKAAGKPRVEYEEAVEEALCFGWIDSKRTKLDAVKAREASWPSPFEREIKAGALRAPGGRVVPRSSDLTADQIRREQLDAATTDGDQRLWYLAAGLDPKAHGDHAPAHGETDRRLDQLAPGIQGLEQVVQVFVVAPGPLGVDRMTVASGDFIACSPFVLVATADRDGRCDVSPRGGPPGFVAVLDERRLLIADARGNRRISSMRNVVEAGHAGLLFLIPGLGETLRVNGRAVVVRDEALLSAHTLGGTMPRSP